MSEAATAEKKMPLLDHLIELRMRLIYCVVTFFFFFFLCFFVAEHIFAFLVRPLADALVDRENARMIYTSLLEGFLTYIKVAFFSAAFISFPIFSSQLWLFVAPGLYKNERRAFLPFLIATPILFLMGGALVYYFIMPLAWEFLLGFQAAGGDGNLPIEVEPKIDQYLSLSMRLIFAFGVAFEMPVLLVLLARVGIVTSDGLARKRRYAIVAVFVAAAILTPPDIVSQIGLAIPIILLYEISIVLARMTERKRDRENAEEAGDAAEEAETP